MFEPINDIIVNFIIEANFNSVVCVPPFHSTCQQLKDDRCKTGLLRLFSKARSTQKYHKRGANFNSP